MNLNKTSFLASALSRQNSTSKDGFMEWFAQRRAAHHIKVERIPFSAMKGWSFERSSGDLVHETGRFFKVEGLSVETNYARKPQWTQPIVNQPEIGILGILAKEIDGVLHFLMQVKTEPGNLGVIQLAPTLQATRSNFSRAHKGRQPPYFEYFVDTTKSRPLVDVLQSEKGARFFKKRNRNIVLEVFDSIPVQDDYRWLTLGEIHRLMRLDNVVNMCARSVLSCINFVDGAVRNSSPEQLLERASIQAGSADLEEPLEGSFQRRLLESELDTEHAVNSTQEIISWFTGLKFGYQLSVERIPLKSVQEWLWSEQDVSHREGKYFSVIAVHFEADNREVTSWTQPLIMQRHEGLVAFVTKEINGVLHFLVQGKLEAGNFDIVEMAPTVQCVWNSYCEDAREEGPAFFQYVLNASPEDIRYRALQSEEGGRFFREQHLNMVIEVGSDFSQAVPPDFIWMTLGQLKGFMRHNNFVNAEARCLVSCLGLIG